MSFFIFLKVVFLFIVVVILDLKTDSFLIYVFKKNTKKKNKLF